MTKSEARQRARRLRPSLSHAKAGSALAQHFPKVFTQTLIAGFSPIGDEINIWPLLKTLYHQDRQICLPVVKGPNQALHFRNWTPDTVMETDHYGVSYPAAGDRLTPQLVLVPLLAFTSRGDRLGYGGGYYDRTLEALRQNGEVFACGVAYAGQEVERLPTEAHDAKLDGILTEIGFKAFA